MFYNHKYYFVTLQTVLNDICEYTHIYVVTLMVYHNATKSHVLTCVQSAPKNIYH